MCFCDANLAFESVQTVFGWDFSGPTRVAFLCGQRTSDAGTVVVKTNVVFRTEHAERHPGASDPDAKNILVPVNYLVPYPWGGPDAVDIKQLRAQHVDR